MAEEITNFIPEQLWNDEFRFLKLRSGGKEPTGDSQKWQENNYGYLDEDLINHILNGGNYGVIGGYGNLIIIDGDSEEISEIAETLPETFTVKTGSPESYKKHYFYICDVQLKPIRLSKEHVGDLGDVRSVGQYVVGANCKHPSGGVYKVIKDVPIAKIPSNVIRDVFSKYINPNENTNLICDIDTKTKFRNSKFIRECDVPDYLLKNKVKGNTSKNWDLFPLVVDILHNREVSISVYQQLAKTQGHDVGAIKGWVKLAHEGKLVKKASCKKMRDYLERFHPEIEEEVCKNCPLYKKVKIKKDIKENKDLSELQKEVFLNLIARDRDKATEIIVNEIENNNHIFTTRDDIKSEMWIYIDGIYVPQGKSFVKEFSRKILGEAFSTHLSNTIISKIETDTFIEHDEFFNTNYLDEIPLLNGILNVRTRELVEHTPKKIFFNKLPIEYDPSAECDDIIEHFKNVLKNEEDIMVMLELFGYLLYKENKVEKAFMLVGGGRNGKSKTIELMKRFIGIDNCASIPLRSLNDESFSLSELFGKMANLAADLSRTDLEETGMIKALIGRDQVQAKRKFLRDLKFTNYAKLVFAANELPKIFDTTDGFWTKWIVFEFPYKFVEKKVWCKLNDEEKKANKLMDTEIIDKLTDPSQLSGLLNLALDGLDRLLKNKEFSYSKNVKEVKDLWIRKSDSFAAFCYDHIEEDVDGKISKKELRRRYHEYHKKHKVPGCSDKFMRVTLENLFGASEYQEWGGDRDRFWVGISFKGF